MRKILSEKLEVFYRSHASEKKTLDVGSRKGRHAKYFPNVTSIDVSPNADPDIVADAHAIPFPDNHFEIVICREVLEHVKDPARVLSEMHRVLVPGGTLLLSTRFLFPIHEAPEDRWRFTNYNLRELLEGWSTITVVDETKPFTAIGCILQRFAWQSDFKFANRICKGLILLTASLCMRLDFLVKKQYGDVAKVTVIPSAFTTGYYVTALK
ncbi:class I SAM-dependent methyltransferase [Patescibacteria group bacterium]|nr:class I SAM-dependent methyltransferase [Patescibacteria group bacterium]